MKNLDVSINARLEWKNKEMCDRRSFNWNKAYVVAIISLGSYGAAKNKSIP